MTSKRWEIEFETFESGAPKRLHIGLWWCLIAPVSVLYVVWRLVGLA